MNFMKSIAILFIAFRTVHAQDESTTLVSTNSDEIDTSTTEQLSTVTVSSETEPTTEPIESSEPYVDTSGDTIITSEPGNDTEDETVSDNISSISETNTTDSITDVTSTTVVEVTTLTAKTNWTVCSYNPCKNGGICQKDSFDPIAYNCNCTHGYTGFHCQVTDNCFVDEDGSICNKGACIYEKEGHSRFCSCFFGMFWDDHSKECREPDPPCFPNPCNNGICEEGDGEFHCSCKDGYEGLTCEIQNQCGEDDRCPDGKCIFDREKSLKYCKCNSDFYWNEDSRKCKAIQPPCLPNPCKNNGACEPIATDEFNCTCAEGFVGMNCGIQDFCLISEDGKEVCENGACTEFDHFRECNCLEGYYLDEKSHSCKETIKPCLPNPCLNDGKCIPSSSGSYNCTCSEGYIGQTCSDNDYCVQKGGNVFCGDALCKNDYKLGVFYCSCDIGQYFDYSSRTCLEIDFCPLMKCDEIEKCENSKCSCKENYAWMNSTGKCEPHFCPSNPCPVNDLICTEGTGIDSYECSCKSGYAFSGYSCKGGAVCEFPSLNNCEQICTATNDGYTCSCYGDHFVLKQDNSTCEFIGNETCTNKTCDNGICLKTDEAEKCICRPGYKEVDGKCVDLCSADDLPEGFCPGNKCEPTDSGFRCKCGGKFTLSKDKTTCTVRKMCEVEEVGWVKCSGKHALCLEDWSTIDGFRCQCMDGQIESEEGFCRDICSIEEYQQQCSILGAECDIDEYGNKTCKCPPYFLPFRNGTACNKPASFSYLVMLPLNLASYAKDEVTGKMKKRSLEMKYDDLDFHAIQKDVRESLRKLFPEMISSRVLSCRESKGYVECKIEMQFSSITEDDLKRLTLPEICHPTEHSTSACLVPPSLLLQKEFIGTAISVHRTDPCDKDIKQDLCGSETFCTSSPSDMTFKCRCEAGFSIRGTLYPFKDSESFIQSCKDIDECATANPCPLNTECKNTLGSYACSCQPGYRIKDASSLETSGCVEICNPNPCVYGDCSKVGDFDFECRCAAGYNGILCDLQDENFKQARTHTIIVGAVLGGALLVVIILSFALISRLKKKKKMLEDSSRPLYGTEMTERRGIDSGTVNNAYQRE